MSKTITYGIDFGTSNSLLAASVDGRPLDPISLDSINKDPQILRSLLYFPIEGPPSFGMSAIQQYTEQAGEGRFLRSFKKHLPSKTFKGTEIHNRFFRLEDLIATFLREMKRRADLHFEQDVKSVVLGRPAKFSLDQSQDDLAQSRLYEAAKQAGFEDIHFFPEPLAAAFDYRSQIKEEKVVLIVDLGGGTSDFTVIRLAPSSFAPEDVLSIGGVSLAGDAMDGEIMANKLAPHFGSKAEYRMPLGSHTLKMPPSLQFQLMSPADIVLLSQLDLMKFLKEVRKCTVNDKDSRRLDQLFSLVRDNLGFLIYEEIDLAKRRVCGEGITKISFHEDEVHIDEEMNLSEFNEFTHFKIEKIFESLDEVLKEAGVATDDVDMICCTGGTSRLPLIQEGLRVRFGQQKLSDLNQFESVIKGLSHRAADIQRL